MEQETRRTFRWGSVVPLALTAIACVVLFAHNAMPRPAFAATEGALLLAAGLVCAVAFFVGQPVHVTRMLAGVVLVSVGLWALITCTNFSRSVLGLGLGVYLVFVAVSDVFAGISARRFRARAAVHFVLAAGYAATGVLLFVHHFSHVFPSYTAALITAGAVMLVYAAEELFFLLRDGFYSEETLIYRPVRNGKNDPSAAKKEEEGK